MPSRKDIKIKHIKSINYHPDSGKPDDPDNSPLLILDRLEVVYPSRTGGRTGQKAVDGVSFVLNDGEALGLTGESGAGKSSLGYAVMGLLPGNGYIAGGRIFFKNKEMPRNRSPIPWNEAAMIFQGAMNALNPVRRIASQMDEILAVYLKMEKEKRKLRIREWMEMLGMEEKHAFCFPHQLSGGMRQRMIIAQALACNPRLLIADEPTTGLDTVTQMEIAERIQHLQRKMGLTLLFISHDLPLVRQICDRVMVMENGRTAEAGPAEEIFQHPSHDHTRRLVSSLRRIRLRKNSA